MLTVTRLLEFDAAHRVMNHESKCATLHGHRYKVEIEATADELDKVGRIIDFSVIKNTIGAWIDERWDHTTIVCRDDEQTVHALHAMPKFKEPFLTDWNPTAENMANFILRVVAPSCLHQTGVKVIRVRVWETPNCFAEAK